MLILTFKLALKELKKKQKTKSVSSCETEFEVIFMVRHHLYTLGSNRINDSNNRMCVYKYTVRVFLFRFTHEPQTT